MSMGSRKAVPEASPVDLEGDDDQDKEASSDARLHAKDALRSTGEGPRDLEVRNGWSRERKNQLRPGRWTGTRFSRLTESSDRSGQVDHRRHLALLLWERIAEVVVGSDRENQDAEPGGSIRVRSRTREAELNETACVLGHSPAKDDGHNRRLLLVCPAEQAHADDEEWHRDVDRPEAHLGEEHARVALDEAIRDLFAISE